MIGIPRIPVLGVEELKVKPRSHRSPDQWAESTRRAAHPEHVQIEQSPRPIQPRDGIVRGGQDAQRPNRARSRQNGSKNAPAASGDGESSCRHRRSAYEFDYRFVKGEITLEANVIKAGGSGGVYERGGHRLNDNGGDGN